MSLNKGLILLSLTSILALAACNNEGGVAPSWDPVNPQERISGEAAMEFAKANWEKDITKRKVPKSAKGEWDFSKSTGELEKIKNFINEQVIDSLLFEDEEAFRCDSLIGSVENKDCNERSTLCLPMDIETLALLIKYETPLYLHDNTYLSYEFNQPEVGIRQIITLDKKGYRLYQDYEYSNYEVATTVIINGTYKCGYN